MNGKLQRQDEVAVFPRDVLGISALGGGSLSFSSNASGKADVRLSAFVFPCEVKEKTPATMTKLPSSASTFVGIGSCR